MTQNDAPEPIHIADDELNNDSRAPRKERNTLALIALIVAIVGFIFACVPGALIVGWILLPIAFILAIVSFFRKGSGKWMGVTALILSVVGTIVGVAVFFTVVANALNESFGSGETSVSAPADAGAAPADKAEGAKQGTRENPYPMGSTISNDKWSVKVDSYNPNGNEVVSAANSMNQPAPAGSHYEIVTSTLTYTGDDKSYAAEVGFDLVTSDGNVINSHDTIVVLSDGFGMDELYKGASLTGSVAFVVPDGASVALRVRPGMLADEVFVQP